eukprot:bmy_19047T0
MSKSDVARLGEPFSTQREQIDHPGILGKKIYSFHVSEGNRDQKNLERKIIDSILCLLYEKRREDIFVPSDSIVKEMVGNALMFLLILLDLWLHRPKYICCVLMLLVPFSLIMISYSLILAAVLQMRSNEARKKAFTTCSSHLSMLGLFFGAGIFTYMRPKSYRLANYNKVVSVYYTIFTPVLNPLIYSLRNTLVNQENLMLHGEKKTLPWVKEGIHDGDMRITLSASSKIVCYHIFNV